MDMDMFMYMDNHASGKCPGREITLQSVISMVAISVMLS